MGAGCLCIEFAGEAFTLMPQRAAWWASRATLLIADMHLGKSETMRVAGLPVPDIDLDEQFDRLDRAIEMTGATRVVVAGDLIHAPAGLTPGLSDRVAARLERVRGRGVAVVLVKGNHDRRIEGVEAAWGLVEIHEELVEGGVRIVHDPSRGRAAGGAFIAGHLHPALPVGGMGGVKAPAFVVSDECMVLPAFSRFTAGGRIARDRRQRWYPIADGQVLEVGAARREAERGIVGA